jgi:hypothetical protein
LDKLAVLSMLGGQLGKEPAIQQLVASQQAQPYFGVESRQTPAKRCAAGEGMLTFFRLFIIERRGGRAEPPPQHLEEMPAEA